MTHSIEINANQERAGFGVEVNDKGDEAVGVAQALISYEKDGIATWEFDLTLGFVSKITHDDDNQPKVAISYLEVTRGRGGYKHLGNDFDDYVKYQLSDEEREIIIPQLESIVLDSLTTESAEKSTISSGSHLKPIAAQHLSLNFHSQGCHLKDKHEAFSGYADGLLNEEVAFIVEFDGSYKEFYEQAEYHGGVLTKPKTANITTIDIENIGYYHFGNINTGEIFEDYDLSEYDMKIIEHIIHQEVKKTYAQRVFPFGESNQYTA